MTLILDLAPTVEARLQAEAHIRDMSVSEFVKMLLARLEELEGEAKARARIEDDPEAILTEAVREMKENQIKNRELAVETITQKNNLQAEVDKEERIIAELARKAAWALKSGNKELARQFFKEKTLHEQVLSSMRVNLVAATEASEKVKEAIKQEEERIRVRTAQALAMKANMKQTQIQFRINEALRQFRFPASWVLDWNENREREFEGWGAKQEAQTTSTPDEEPTATETNAEKNSPPRRKSTKPPSE